MAINSVKIGVNVDDGGSTKKVIKYVNTLHKSLEGAANVANKINVGGGASAKKAAYMPSASSAPATSGAAMAAYKEENTSYGVARSAVGTGAAGRDFAQQAQGLGGLVRLYATYAANIFAVGAAFRALSSAMDTTNMVKGLNQLGAASGTALGSLSKRFVEVTDGAVSMREAMEAVTKASSSGLLEKDTLRIAAGAKKAAQALGVDMGDAVSRLTRGITKLEPELLDELGIFVRVDTAAAAYAKTIGKSASALTDFEKRMAFAAAALDQVESKFGEIDIDTNPYTKLLATVKDTTQSVLELVNMGLTPLVKLLSSNPTALLAVLGAVGVKLVRQAIPALADYRKSLEDMSIAAAQTAKARLQDVKSSASAEITERINALNEIAQAEAEAFIARSEEFAALQESTGKKLRGYDKRAFEISQTELSKITPEDIKYLEELGSKNTKISATYRDLAQNLDTYTKAEKGHKDAQKDLNVVLNKNSSLFTSLGQNELEYHTQVNAARARGMVSNVAYTASTKGFVAGLTESWKSFKEAGTSTTTTIDLLDAAGAKTGATLSAVTPKMGLFSRGMLLVKLSTVSTVAAIGTAINAFMPWIQILTMAVAVVSSLVSWLSKNSKELSAFNSSISAAKESVKTLGETIDFINKKPFGQQFTTESLEARAKAFAEVSSQVSDLVKNLEQTDKAANGLDRFIDGFKTIWGGDVRSKFAKSMTETVIGALDKAGNTAEASKAREKIAKLLNIDPKFTTDAFNKAIAKSADSPAVLKSVADAMKLVTNEAGNLASVSRELDDSLKASGDAYKSVVDQFKVKDPLALLGESLISSSQKLSEALKDPITAIQKLSEIASDPEKLKLFGSSDQANLIKYSKQLTNINKDIDEQTRAVETLKTARKEAQSALEERAKGIEYDASTNTYYSDEQLSKMDSVFKERLEKVKEQETRLLEAENKLTKARAASQVIVDKFPNLVANQLQKGADLIGLGISAAMSKASLIFRETVLGSIGDVPGVAKAREKIELEKIAADRTLIQVTMDLVRATMENTVAIQLAEAKQEVILQAGRGSEKESIAARRVTELETKQRIVTTDPKLVLASMGKIISEVKAGNKEISADAAGLINYLNSVAASGAALAGKDQEARSARFKAQIETVKEQFAVEKRALADQKETLSVEQRRVTTAEQLNGFTTESSLLAQDKLSNDLILLNAQEKLLDISQKRAVLEKAFKTGASGLSKADVDKELDRLKKEESSIVSAKDQSISEKTLATSQKLVSTRTKELERVSQLATKQSEIADILESIKTTSRDVTLETAEQTNLYSKDYLESLKKTKELQDIESTARKTARDEESAFNLKKSIDTEKLAELELSGATEAATRLREEMNLESTLHNTKLQQIEEEKQARLKAIDEVAAYRKEREDFASLIEGIKSIDDSWAGVGTKLAEVMTAQDAFNTSQKQFAKTFEELDEKLFNAKGPEEQNKLFGEIEKTQKSQQKAEITGYAKTAGAAKSMFKEKTFAHKAFAAVEKILHITRLAMDLKEMFFDTAKTGVAVANSATRTGAAVVEAGVDGVKAVIKAIASLPFPLNIAAGAATAAVVAGLLSKIGGKSPSVGGGGFTPSAEQLQETQGTAMGWDAKGNKVQTSRGVFGDTDAKSESIANSLEIIRDNSVDGLAYDNKMLRALEGLRDALDATAKGLYGIRGLRAGSLSGLEEGTNTSGGLLGIGGLFSKSTTKNIIDSGIQLQGTFYDLINGVKGTINTFETVSTTVKKSGFFGIGGSTKTNVATQFKELSGIDAKAFDSLVNAFGYAADTLYTVAETAGVSSTAVENALKSIRVDEMASLRGLTGEDFTKELSNVIGKVLDDASYTIFTSFEQYANFGEGMLETVIRVVDTNKKVNQALSNIGKTSKTLEYSISEVLVKAAGGLDIFLDKAEFFRQNFLSEAEQLAPIQSAVTTELARISKLGYTSADGLVDTRKEFKALVSSLDLTTERGRDAYTALMNVAEGFDTVMKVTEDALQKTIDKFKSFAQSLREFRDNLVLGSASILTPLQKYAESKLQFEENYTKALAGDEQAQSKLTGSAQAFLEASKGYFASSSAYTQDFNSVLEKIGYGITSAEASVSVAELQLGVANTQVDLLTSINTNIAILAGVPQLARGGLGRGLTLVGEVGPELVDFNQPGRVYTADQTAGMFAPRANVSNNMFAVVAELRQVKQEIAQLRKEQQQQTGDLIVSNYDANQRNAKEVAQAVEEVNTSTQWASRNEVTIV